MIVLLGVACVLFASCDAPPGSGPLVLPHPDSVLTWTPDQQLAGFPNYDRLFDTRPVRAGPEPLALPERPMDFSDLRYDVAGRSYGLDDFFEHNRVSGLLVIHNGTIVLEEYGLGHGPEGLWVSYSVTKSIVSLLYGAAIRDGFVGGVDDLVTDYVPELAGSSYDGVTIENLLNMASGVDWNEDYTDPEADVSREIGLPNAERLRFLSTKSRVAVPGTRFNYNTGETHLAGVVLSAAVGEDLATYLTRTIWAPFGMERDANWRLVEPDGAVHGGCCISATLRDFGKMGLFALADGVLPDGDRVLAEGWMEASTAPSGPNPDYGYLWWLGDGPAYGARGIFGQGIFIDPSDQTVIAMNGAWQTPVGQEFSAHRDAFIAAVKARLGSTSRHPQAAPPP